MLFGIVWRGQAPQREDNKPDDALVWQKDSSNFVNKACTPW